MKSGRILADPLSGQHRPIAGAQQAVKRPSIGQDGLPEGAYRNRRDARQLGSAPIDGRSASFRIDVMDGRVQDSARSHESGDRKRRTVSARPGPRGPRALSDELLHLQRTAGNAAVAAMMVQRAAPPAATVAAGTPPVAIDADVQAIWDANTAMQASFGKDVRKFQKDTQDQWTATSSKDWFSNDIKEYRKFVPTYVAIGIPDLGSWIDTNISTAHFCGLKAQTNKDIQADLTTASTAIGAAHGVTTFEGFNVRMIRGSTTSLSLHGVGRAVDINSDTNPQFRNDLGRDSAKLASLFRVIEAVTGTDVRAATDYASQHTASDTFKTTFNKAWVDTQKTELATRKKAAAAAPTDAGLKQKVQDQQQLYKDIAAVRSTLNGYASTGFLTLNQVVVDQLVAAGFTWGGTWDDAKDYMHFEKGAVGP
jgi:hypothetical protein